MRPLPNRYPALVRVCVRVCVSVRVRVRVCVWVRVRVSALPYMEPPFWTGDMRPCLGEVMLRAKMFAEAEQGYSLTRSLPRRSSRRSQPP